METRVKEGRTALAITLFLVATLTVPAVLLGNASSQAQQGQPSPSGTGPAIQLYNPSDYQNPPQMSDEPANQNGGDSTREYHFTASIANMPSFPLVEFFLIQGNNPPFFLGNGTFNGTIGAVELERDIPDQFTEGPAADDPRVNTGAATVRAILYSNNGANEVARDEQAVTLNQRNRPPPQPPAPDPGPQATDPETAAETVEITSPANGDDFGFYRRPAGGAVGVVEVQWSDGTDEVAVYYTVTPPDVDPTWKDCGTEEPTGSSSSESSAQDGVRCTLVDGDQPEAVTGVAAVAYDTEVPSNAPFPNSGDAHRVRGYSQRPTAVVVEDDQVPAASLPDCTELLFARVTDENDRPIAGINVDVHARGPNDNLAFATHVDEQDDFNEAEPDDSKAPDNHPTEPGRRCSSDGLTGAPQGVHAAGGGQPDRKHIETAVQTDDDGEFIFRLWSDAEGATTVTAWAEIVDDDRYCSDEPAGSSVITWGSGGTAPPAEAPEPQPCPNPSPSSPASTSPSSTSPSTGTTSASPSTSSPPSASPSQTTASPSRSTTGTQGATTTTTTTAAQADREVTLEASESRKTFGKTFTLSGAVTSSNAACVSGVNVAILRDVVGGASEFVPFEQEGTSAGGTFSINVRADLSATYIAQVDDTTACEEASSSPQTVLVRVKVNLRTSDGRVRQGQRVRLTVTTAPCPATAGDRVLLFRAIEGQFGKAGGKSSNDSCRATFKRRISQSTVFQGRWPKQTPEFIAGRSRSKAVRVIR